MISDADQNADSAAELRSANGKLRVLDLFSGIGGFSLGLERTGGFETVAFCEIDKHARAVLKKNWPAIPVYEDVRAVTVSQLAADGIRPNFIAGGFPCQDASIANVDGEGIRGARTGLFFEVVRLIGELGPEGVLLENVANLLNRGFGDVLGALASVGYDAEWHCIPASRLGFPHQRDRVWIMAYPSSKGRERFEPLHGALEREITAFAKHDNAATYARRFLDSNLAGVRGRDGVSVAMERRRLGQCGNAVVPQIPELIGRAILEARA
jgi:DNA (cytosine-5)-methyltransferase 1